MKTLMIKQCVECKKEFSSNYNRQKMCFICYIKYRAAYKLNWQRENKELLKERRAKRFKNLDERKKDVAKNVLWQKKNKGKCRLRQLRWRTKNRIKVQTRAKIFSLGIKKKENPEIFKSAKEYFLNSYRTKEALNAKRKETVCQ